MEAITESIKVEHVFDGVIKIVFPSFSELAKAFLRFQEYQESPEFRGKVFTQEEFLIWYNNISGKNYLEEWEAFNLSPQAIRPFLEGKFNPLYPEEKIILEVIKSFQDSYLIGIAEPTKIEDELHEIAHALYYKNQEYKKEVDDLLKQLDKKAREEIVKFLSRGGAYHPDVWEDEAHAYIMFNLSYMEEECVNLNENNIREMGIKLRQVFDKYYKLK